MSAVAYSAITKVASYPTDGTNSHKYTEKRVTVVLVTQGSVANPLTAAALGFKTLVTCSNAISSDNIVYSCAPSFDGTLIIFAAGDITKTVTLTVKGHLV